MRASTSNKNPQRRWPQTTGDGIRQPERASDSLTHQLALELFELRGFAFEVITAFEHCANLKPSLEALRGVLRSPFALDISAPVRAALRAKNAELSAAGSGDNAARVRAGDGSIVAPKRARFSRLNGTRRRDVFEPTRRIRPV